MHFLCYRALHIAAFEGHAAVVDVLIKKGIAISSLDKNRWSALHGAAKEGHLAICERLLVEGGDPSVAVRRESRFKHVKTVLRL